MAEYIEREAVNAAIDSCRLFYKWQDKSECEAYNTINKRVLKERVAAIPAADVRPVVLCRDCIHFQQFRAHDGFCQIDGMLWNNDFFCANGKREES